MKSRRKLLCTTGVSVVVASAIAIGGGQASFAASPAGGLATIPAESAELPPGTSLANIDGLGDDGFSLEINDSLTEILSNPDLSSSIVTTSWNADTKQLEVITGGNVAAVTDAAHATFPAGTVKIVESTYSGDELRAEATRIARASAASDGSVAWAAAANDGEGITVGLKQTAPTARSTAPVISSAYPVETQTTGAAKPAQQRDGAGPTFGGAAMVRVGAGNGCSTAFAVGPRNDINIRGMLTAGHCGEIGDNFQAGFPFTNYPKSSNRGVMTVKKAPHDAAVLREGASQVYPYVFFGGTITDQVVPVNGAAYAALNSTVYNSGALSGVSTGTVVQNNVTTCVSLIECYSDQVRLNSTTAGSPLYGNGDSGGASIRIVEGKIFAVGIISTIDTQKAVPCAGFQSTGRVCATTGSLQTVSSFLAGNTNYGVLALP